MGCASRSSRAATDSTAFTQPMLTVSVPSHCPGLRRSTRCGAPIDEANTMNTPDMAIFGGSGSLRLTQRICDYLGMSRGQSEVIRFSEGNLFVRVRENVRGRHVY